jgi:hypothetical protein
MTLYFLDDALDTLVPVRRYGRKVLTYKRLFFAFLRSLFIGVKFVIIAVIIFVKDNTTMVVLNVPMYY